MKISPEYDFSSATWHRSSYSDGSGGNCLEIATLPLPVVPVRDSKTPLGPALVFRAEAWSLFVEDLKRR
jgi:hypothetical protein